MRTPIVLVSLLFLSGCAFGSLERLRLADPEANDFSSSLSAEYLAYANAQSEQGDMDMADYFAAKGMRAWHDETVDLEAVDTANAVADTAHMRATRDVLQVLLDDEITRVVPQQAARAQLLFDCWVKSTAMKKDGALCVEELHSALSTLEEVGASLGRVEEENRTVNFSGGSSRLDRSDVRQLTGVAASARGHAIFLVVLSGEAGTTAERTLLARRMTEIRRTLVARGVPAAHIHARTRHSEKAVLLDRDDDRKPHNGVDVSLRVFVPAAPEGEDA